MKKILYVVHRYPPFPGGSEYFVRDMAEETARRGHQVAVFSTEHMGDQNGIRVTNDKFILAEEWDLIVVHGGDVSAQNMVHNNSHIIPSPILYMLILPSTSETCMHGLKNSKFIGCSSIDDWIHVDKYGVRDKAIEIRHGIDPRFSIGQDGFKQKYGITTKRMFLSCGGFWQHKGFDELIDSFNKANLPDTTLVLTGYDNRSNLKRPDTEFVKSFMLDDKMEAISAIKEADLYILNSYTEGFGLVLLESMLNHTPWVARDIAGATTMKEFGFTYTDQDQLIDFMKNFDRDATDTTRAYNYVTSNRLISNTVDDILNVIR